jgi:cytochrome c oxidase cbb3-type subunit 2
MIKSAKADLEAQIDPDADSKGLLARYPKAVLGSATGDPKTITEMDALVAYLQMLGTLVTFDEYKAKDLQQ